MGNPFDDLVNDVRFSPDGNRIAVAAADRYAYVLDAIDGARINVLGPHGDDVNAVRWSPDGKGLVCVMDHLDETFRFWRETETGWSHTSFVGHGSGVFGAAFSPTGTQVVTVAEDETARIWNLDSGVCGHILAHPGDPEAVDWSPDGRHIVTGCDDGIARVWDANNGALIREINDAGAAVRFVRFSQDGTRMLLGSYDAIMRVYEPESWRVLQEIQGPFQWERAGSFGRKRIYIGGFRGEPVSEPATQQKFRPTFGINSVAVHDGAVVVGRDDGAVVDVLNGVVLCSHETIVNTVAVAPGGTIVASGDYRGGIKLCSLGNEFVPVVQFKTDDGGPINSIVWTSDSTFYTGGYDGCIRTWNADGQQLQRIRAHNAPIKSLAWSASHAVLVAGSSDGTLSAWKADGLEWRAANTRTVLINSVAIAEEAKLVFSASRDLALRAWNLDTGDLVETIESGHTKSVKTVDVDPTGEFVVTGAYDGRLIVRSRRSNKWVHRSLSLHGKPGLSSVALDRRVVYSAGWDGTVGRWSNDGRLLAQYNFAHLLTGVS